MQKITFRDEAREPQERMIEFCTKRRMALAILLLMSVSIVVLVVENSVSMGRSMGTDNVSENGSEHCRDNMKSEVMDPCAPCSQFDVNVHEVCLKTGYKERIKCVSSSGEETIHYFSCPKQSHVEERKFWIFELVAAVVGMAAYAVILCRQRHLDKQLLEKVHKQVAAGV